ncbi:MAG: type VI secretion system tip protein VgrG [Candidatus Thiosymbion ectosymbiont of Robbea hypermnestra]|nr:type VI secretion system tip protein VgrG [Candidatus Thiosymbion ectosymbiont of Robbea hypermnestra]
MPLSQQERSLAVATPLGEDVLLVRAMHATEHLSTLFAYELELLSTDIDIQPEDLLGQPVTVRLDLPDGGIRYFNGLVNRFAHTGFEGALAIYQATLAPWTWFLTRTADCRIFQEKKVPDILKEIFREHGYTDFEEALSGDYRQWVYCVQYRETDFNFISRLMEQEGIYYYFKHENGKHTLVLADDYSAHGAVAGYGEIPYYPPSEKALRERDHIHEWSLAQVVQPGAFTHTDFDFTAPRKNLLAKRQHPKSHPYADLEIYEYPGGYVSSDDGESYARVRIEEFHAGYETAQGAGNARGLTTGALFKLTNYRREDQNREYLLIAAEYHLQSDAFGSTAQASTGPVFQCAFTALEAQTPYRPSRTTPKPRIQGPQTAIVVGKDGEEIWTDQHGRVKVQFHWDRYGKSDEHSSCWMRVAHPWAGRSWGAIAIPRIGQEVMVEFLEGDPDQPIITGGVYNGVNQPPYSLPDKATVTTLKSNSSKGGAGFNEIRLEDKKGQEQLFVHAEKDQDVRVKHDAYEWIGNERHLIVKTDQIEQVEGDKHVTVKGDRNEKISGSVSLDTAMDLQQKVGINHAVEAGTEIHLKGGMNVVIEAGMSITLKAGSGFVVVGPAGVTISGTPVLINSGGSAGSGAGCSPDTPKLPKEAVNAEPGGITDLTGVSGPFENPQAQTLAVAAESGAPFCEKCAAAQQGG